MSEERTVIVATDGACKGNPGPGGWGAVLRWGDVVKTLSGGEAQTTNNRMALIGAIAALAALTRHCRVDLSTDSVYVRAGITKWVHGLQRNDWKHPAREPVANADLTEQLDANAGLLRQIRSRMEKAC